jgi:peptide deformylase
MILPVLTYGKKELRRQCAPVSRDHPAIDKIIDNMWDTMRNAEGCGLAAPQVGLDMQLFIIDSKTSYNNLNATERTKYYADDDTGIVGAFMNARIIRQSEEEWEDDEGCLSIPGVTQRVKRPWEITIAFVDQNFNEQVKTFRGPTARMIQHEYDHTCGILYIDRLPPMKRKMLASKLKAISRGLVKTRYPMR